MAALERFSPEFRERHIEAHFSGDLEAVDTFFVGHLKAIGKVYLQTASTAARDSPGRALHQQDAADRRASGNTDSLR